MEELTIMCSAFMNVVLKQDFKTWHCDNLRWAFHFTTTFSVLIYFQCVNDVEKVKMKVVSI